MKSVLLAMTEDQHDHRSWRSTGMVAVLLLITLALNVSAREQAALVRETYQDRNDTALLIFTAIVTLGQVLAAFGVITADWPDKEAMAIILFSHAGAVFLHDFLLSMGGAHNFVLVAFLQPLLSLATLWIVTAVIARSATWSSALIISVGCTLMSIKSSSVLASDRTSLICLLSAFSMILRNIVIRQLVFTENVRISTRKPQILLTLAGSAIFILFATYALASPVWVAPVFCALTTCALSASQLYVTVQLLRTYNIVFLAVFNIWAFLLETVILMPMDHRPDLVALLLGLIMVVIGHYLFFKDHVEHTSESSTGGLIPSHSPKPVNIHEQYTRAEFLLFAAMVMGVIFYVFQPQVSQRDLNTLSYVGLDKVIRRLLTISEKDVNHPSLQAGEVQLP